MAGPADADDAGFEIDDLQFVQLDPSEHEITDFDCGDVDLNEFINSTEAATYQKQRLGATTLVFHDEELAAYYTLAPSALTKKEYAGDEHPDVEEVSDLLANIPSLLIGRFAVAREHQGEGLGRLLVEWIIAWALEQREILFRFIILHAKGGVVDFYERCGFILSESRKNKNRNQKIMFYVLDPLLDA